MKRRLSLFLLAASAAAVGAWAFRPKAAEAAAAAGSTPGQLTIVGKDGKPAGLCPLKHTDVKADISGYVSRVTVTQEFGNPSSTPVEAIYTFPLPGDAAVDDMTMTIGSRIVRGQIKRREEAREIYEAAKANGQAAALLDQERPNIFTQSVANIMPGDGVVITISYVNLLKYDDGRYEWVFPMVVGPRYVPAGGYTTPGKRGDPSTTATIQGDPGTTPVVTDAHKITPPITPPNTRAGHDISLTVRLDAGIPLTEVASTLHKVNIQRVGPTGAIIRLANQAEIPNKDFILHYTAAGSQVQEGLLAYAPSARTASLGGGAGFAGGYFTLIVQPPMAPMQTDISPKEMVFVIDQTGSQQGWPIAKAKETMRYCIKQMNPDDTFQLIGFNTDVYPCFGAPVHNTADNVQKALKFLEPIEGSGGTDILKSVDYALKIPDDPNRLRIVCYMTDGYVGNDMQIIDYIGKHRGRARMFPFGVGNSVNRFLIDGMAREGKGVAEYVTVESNAGPMMGTANSLSAQRAADASDVAARFYKRIASPLLLNPTVDWGGLPVEDVYPKQIPDLFTAGPIILEGRYTHPGEGDVTIHGIVRGNPWQRTIHVVLPAATQNNSALSTLWAREKIEDLQNQDWLGAQTGNPKPNIQQQIINTALEYRLMSQYTSFVAVEERVVNVGGKQRTLDVPVEMPEGVSYDGIFGGSEEQQVAVQFGKPMSKRAMLGRGVAAGGLGGASSSFGAYSNVNRQAAAQVPALNQPAKLGLLVEKESLADSLSSDEYRAKDIRDGKEAGDKALKAMKPEDRRALLSQVKLAPALLQKLDAWRKAKPGDRKSESLEVFVWLNSLPADGMAKLKAAGFTPSATLTPGKLLLGMVSIDKLDALLEMSFVRRIEAPRFK